MEPRGDAAAESPDSFEFTFEFYLDRSARIEADPNPANNDRLETASLTESIFDYHTQYGRTYHAYRAGSYYVPNDHLELERIDSQYEILKILLDGRLYLAPLSHENPPRKIIDFATGTGRWAIDMADEFPQAQIIGTDLSPIQPQLVPPNLRFEIDDGNEEWQTGSDWFDIDYIHFRVTVAAWSDWPWMIRNSLERLRPGGWLEMQEPDCDIDTDDGEIPPDNALKRWFADLRHAGVLADRPVHIVPDLKQMFIEAGFVDVHEKVYKIPLNGWPRSNKLKKIGEMWQRSLGEGLSGFSYAYFDRWLNMRKEEIEVALVDVRNALADQRVHGYEKFYVVWGRKPEYPGDRGAVPNGQSIYSETTILE
ncbi:S-adenosyl-L-methionine-dependent methyltransferase [Lasiosphaeris hirsuta]|uniref:S-adenosyl-L-methionine-dependent methyltransferase n=1 Tax=Lasiosphaeris hirsuta TaxID=260670 RepID=A0AA39ZRF4_9PEZI|nr:S-adenosyl-L-methionine-dependent methyltransferase [Lasiosphaeris hirsuta]